MKKYCIFCDRSTFEGRIIWESNLFFIVATLGQITDGGHLLLIPKQHISCMGSAGSACIAKIDTLQKRISQALMFEYHVPNISILEHGIAGQTVDHAHIHFIPAECEVSEKIRNNFPRSQARAFYSWNTLRAMYLAKQRPYLIWHDKNQMDSWKTVLWPTSPVPSQYLRTVFAEVIGRPERRDWRNVDPDSDWKLIGDTVERMKKYFKQLKA